METFSISIVALLRQTNTKIHLVDPSFRLLQIIPGYLDRRQISSVRLSGTFAPTRHDSPPFGPFDQLISLTLFNCQWQHEIGQFTEYFPHLQAVCLWSDHAFNFDQLSRIVSMSFRRITRLKIRCEGVRCDHYMGQPSEDPNRLNTTVKTFIFDSGHSPLSSKRRCPFYRSCGLRSIAAFTQSLVNVRRVRLVTSRHQIDEFLGIAAWRQLIAKCVHLDQVTIQLLDEGHFMQKTVKIQRELRRIRPELTFRIKSV
jgi:hypothetical protein